MLILMLCDFEAARDQNSSINIHQHPFLCLQVVKDLQDCTPSITYQNLMAHFISSTGV